MSTATKVGVHIGSDGDPKPVFTFDPPLKDRVVRGIVSTVPDKGVYSLAVFPARSDNGLDVATYFGMSEDFWFDMEAKMAVADVEEYLLGLGYEVVA